MDEHVNFYEHWFFSHADMRREMNMLFCVFFLTTEASETTGEKKHMIFFEP